MQKQTQIVGYPIWTEIGLLTKFKLSMVVVITSVLGFFLAGGHDMRILACLFFGGWMITAASNTFNQILERDHDALMSRTENRPLAAGRMKLSVATLIGGLLALFGILLLAMINPLTVLLGTISMLLYSYVYTPLKRYTTAAVAIGAIPGALPVMIGATAAEGTLTTFAIVLFLIQFLWQFPHFWSIGWLSFEDYKKAGFKLLPMDIKTGNIDSSIGLHSLVYAILLLPTVGFLYYMGDIGVISLIGLLIFTIVYIYYSYKFYKALNEKSAKSLMFYSFAYLPIIFGLIILFK